MTIKKTTGQQMAERTMKTKIAIILLIAFLISRKETRTALKKIQKRCEKELELNRLSKKYGNLY